MKKSKLTMKDTSVIPKGPYCHGLTRKEPCPYWSLREDKPYQRSGYCSFLEKGDWDLELEYAQNIVLRNPDRTTRKLSPEEALELPLSLSLLWDQCKECGINEDYEEDD